VNTEIVIVETPWSKPLEEVLALGDIPQAENRHEAGDRTVQTLPIRDRPSVRTMLDEFADSLRDNPKAWAVCAGQDASGTIHVWTYVDSNQRGDRSAVYAAEWQLLSRYREVAFDFNVVLGPAGSEQFKVETFDYLFLR
jgi:hypothetical protein